MADLLSSLIEILAPSAMAGPPVPNVMPPEGPTVQPVQSPRFGIGGQLGQLPQPANVQPTPPPGFSVGTGALPVADEMLKMFAPPAPTAVPMPRAPMPVPRAPSQGAMLPPMPPQQQQDNAGITGADVQRFIRSVATGAGRADPRAPGAAAFAQGAMGSLQNSYQEGERERAVRLNERRADIADRRADQALTMQQQRDLRAEQEYNRKVKRDEDVERERQVRTQERLARIAKITDQRLDSKDIGRIGDQVNRHARYLQVEVNQGRMTPEQAEKGLEEYKRDTIEKFVTRNPAARAQPGTGGPQGQPNPGAVYEYQGKRYRYNNGNWEPVQ